LKLLYEYINIQGLGTVEKLKKIPIFYNQKLKLKKIILSIKPSIPVGKIFNIF